MISRKNTTVFIVLFFISVCIIYGYRINFPAEPYYDEEHYVPFTRELINNQHYSTAMTSHPPLWHVITSLGVYFFGDYPHIWRVTSLAPGLALILVVFLLAREVTQDIMSAYFAAFLFTFDCISFTQARISMPNAMMLLLAMLSLLFFLKYFRSFPESPPRTLAFSGVFFGLALAAKLTALSILPVFIVITLVYVVKSKGSRLPLSANALMLLLLLPGAVYLANYLFIPFLKAHTWGDIFKIQAQSLTYHLTTATTQTHTYSSKWWGWPLMLRPIWYYYKDTAGTINGIICIGNPVVFWMLPAAILFILFLFIKKRTWASGLILLGFFCQWGFYALGGRIKFFHYFYNAMPFAVMALSVAGSYLWRSGRTGRIAVMAYFILVVAMFVYWYPLLNGMPISETYFRQHMWFSSWI